MQGGEGTGKGSLANAMALKAESARSTIRTSGQRARICPTIRATSSAAPAEPSMFERRSFEALIHAAGPFRRLLADKGYDANHFRKVLAERGAEAVIPSTPLTARAYPLRHSRL